jgi:hypothetical protein
MVNIGQSLVKYSQTLTQKPLTCLATPGLLSCSSEFHLNTSNSPNVKVVHFVEGHNFHVERHLRFEVERGVKPWSTQHSTIHRHHENCQVGMPFVHNLLAKTSKCLRKSCGG